MSTGAVLPAQGFTYIHEKIKSDVKIGSISGGTDIVGCFLGGNPLTPTYAGQLNGPMLGMNVQVWDDDGNVQPAGQAGELVCTNPFPSMPLRFLDDENGARYTGEYFEHYGAEKHVWRHGDSIVKTPEGQFIIIGRSDATLNQNGVRIGTGAIYDQLAPFRDKIREAAAIDFCRPDNSQTITVLFLALNDNAAAVPADLEKAIKAAVKSNVGPYSVPTEIIAVPGVLKTPNGKIAEVVMKKILAVVVVAALAAAGWYFYSHREAQAGQPVFATTTAARGDITQVVTASGQLEPLLSVDVGSQISGQVKRLYVDFNSTVTKGQKIAEIDPATYEQRLRQAEADLASTEASTDS